MLSRFMIYLQNLICMNRAISNAYCGPYINVGLMVSKQNPTSSNRMTAAGLRVLLLSQVAEKLWPVTAIGLASLFARVTKNENARRRHC